MVFSIQYEFNWKKSKQSLRGFTDWANSNAAQKLINRYLRFKFSLVFSKMNYILIAFVSMKIITINKVHSHTYGFHYWNVFGQYTFKLSV